MRTLSCPVYICVCGNEFEMLIQPSRSSLFLNIESEYSIDMTDMNDNQNFYIDFKRAGVFRIPYSVFHSFHIPFIPFISFVKMS